MQANGRGAYGQVARLLIARQGGRGTHTARACMRALAQAPLLESQLLVLLPYTTLANSSVLCREGGALHLQAAR